MLNEKNSRDGCPLNNKFAKAKNFVQIGIDAEDYYRIKDSEKDTDE